MKLNECKYKVGDKVWFVDCSALRCGLIQGVKCSQYDQDFEVTDKMDLEIRVMKKEFDEGDRYSQDSKYKVIKMDHDEVFESKKILMDFMCGRSDTE